MNKQPWRPQFTIYHALVVTTLFAIAFGIAISPVLHELFGNILIALGSSLIVTGIIYARKPLRALFIGAGVPLVGVLYLLAFERRIHPTLLLLWLLLCTVCGMASLLLAWWLTREVDE